MDKSQKDFYCYVHRRADDPSVVFYVGKGRAQRAWSVSQRNQHWRNVYAKHGMVVEIIKGNLTNAEACALEVETIAHYGQENLTNMSAGGESGFAGGKHTSETKAKIAEHGRNISEEIREKLRITSTGRKRSPESIAKSAAALRGRKRPPDVCAKMSASHTGKKRPPRTPEHRAKISAAHRGKRLSMEHRAKIAARPITAEMRANMSAAHHAHRRRIKAQQGQQQFDFCKPDPEPKE